MNPTDEAAARKLAQQLVRLAGDGNWSALIGRDKDYPGPADPWLGEAVERLCTAASAVAASAGPAAAWKSPRLEPNGSIVDWTNAINAAVTRLEAHLADHSQIHREPSRPTTSPTRARADDRSARPTHGARQREAVTATIAITILAVIAGAVWAFGQGHSTSSSAEPTSTLTSHPAATEGAAHSTATDSPLTDTAQPVTGTTQAVTSNAPDVTVATTTASPTSVEPTATVVVSSIALSYTTSTTRPLTTSTTTVRATTTTRPTPSSTTAVTTTSTTTVPIQILSESYSPSSINLPAQTSVNVTVTLRDLGGRLPSIAGARLCAPGSTNPNAPWCTGATMSRNGTAFSASYTGLFIVNTSGPTGAWFAYYFWPVGQVAEFQLRGSATVQVTRI